MNRLAHWALGAYPAGFISAYVLLSFSATPTPISGLWRPLLVAIALTLLVQLIVAGLTRSWRTAGFITAIGVMAAAASWLLLAVAAAIVIWWLLTSLLRRRAGRPPARVEAQRAMETLAVFGLGLAVFAAVPVIGWGVTSMNAMPEIGDRPTADGAAPDIAVVILDGYPRNDSMREQFGHDNGRFTAALESRGFDVWDEGRSNYTSTWATIASMLEMRYLEDIEELNPRPADPAEQYRRIMSSIASASGLAEFRERGYDILAIPSPFESASLTSADRTIDTGHMTSFELSLFQHSPIGQAVLGLRPELFFDDHRDRITDTFDLIPSVLAEPAERPRLLFAHIMSPHAPVVFEADGDPAAPFACFPGCSPWAFTSLEQYDGFAPQVEHINQLVVNAVDRIAEQAPNSVVVLMSDHGSQMPGMDGRNAFRTLFAARTPHRDDVFEDATPVNLMPQLLNAYADGHFELEPYQAWRNEFAAPLTMEPLNGPKP